MAYFNIFFVKEVLTHFKTDYQQNVHHLTKGVQILHWTVIDGHSELVPDWSISKYESSSGQILLLSAF